MSSEGTAFTVRFDAEGCRHAREVGGKAHGLAEMTAAGLPVAPGFTVTAAAYREFLDQGDLRTGIAEALDDVAADRPETSAAAEQRISELVVDAPLPRGVADAVRAAYAALCEEVGVADVPVAVRSSATAEDSAADSFAGEFETWVDVRGGDDVLRHVHRCYASVFAARVMSYAAERGMRLDEVDMAVVVQKTVRARSSGVMFTLDPISGDRSRVVLEASWGLGLAVVGGEVTPDRYVVSKVGLDVTDRVLGDKRIEYRTGDASVEVAADRREQLCLVDDEVLAVARLGKHLEKLVGRPQDVEFAIDEDLPGGANVILLQCRPETVWSNQTRAPAFDSGAGVMSWITGSITSDAPGGTAPRHRHE